MNKICTKCKSERPINQFYKHGWYNGIMRMASWCKECKKEYWASDRHKEVRRIYRKTIKHKIKAKDMVRNRVLSGKIKQELCEVCGNEQVEGHHDDYNKPLEVRWLCREHHLNIHRRPTATLGTYKGKSNE